MNFKLDKPAIVREATEAKKGLNVLGEIGVFILVFLAGILGEMLLLLPFILTRLFANSNFSDLFTSEDINIISKITDEINSSDEFAVASMFAMLATILIVLLFCKFIQKRRMRTLGFKKKDAIKEFLKGLFFGFLMFSAAVLICIFTGSIEFEDFLSAFMPGLFTLFFIAFLIQGMAKEVMLRGYFLVSLGRRNSMLTAILLSSVMFALIHLRDRTMSPLVFLNLTLLGIFSSIHFIKSENIWEVAALHSMWSFAEDLIYGLKIGEEAHSGSVFSIVLIEGKELINGGSHGLEGGLAVTIIVLLGIIFLLRHKPHTPIENHI